MCEVINQHIIKVVIWPCCNLGETALHRFMGLWVKHVPNKGKLRLLTSIFGSWVVSYPVGTNIWYNYLANRLGYLVNTPPNFCYHSKYPAPRFLCIIFHNFFYHSKYPVPRLLCVIFNQKS